MVAVSDPNYRCIYIGRLHSRDFLCCVVVQENIVLMIEQSKTGNLIPLLVFVGKARLSALFIAKNHSRKKGAIRVCKSL